MPSGGVVHRIIVLVDGLGDVSPAGLSSPSHSHPHLDTLFSYPLSHYGLLDPVTPGEGCGSDTSHLSLFGYSPYHHYCGRGGYECVGSGFSLSSGSLAFKSNFALHDNSTRTVIRRAAGPFDFVKNGAGLCEWITARLGEEGGEWRRAYSDITVEVHHQFDHRCIVILRDAQRRLCDRIGGTDPLKEGETVRKARAVGEEDAEAEFTAAVVNALTDVLVTLLPKNPFACPATLILLRGPSSFKVMEPLVRRRWHGTERFIATAQSPIVVGVMKSMEATMVDPKKSSEGKEDERELAQEFCGTIDSAIAEDRSSPMLAFLHFKSADEASHAGDSQLKGDIMERIDSGMGDIIRHLVEVNEKDPSQRFVLVFTSDHSTPTILREHSYEPVAFLAAIVDEEFRIFYSSKPKPTKRFSEAACSRGPLGRIRGAQVPKIIHALAEKAASVK